MNRFAKCLAVGVGLFLQSGIVAPAQSPKGPAAPRASAPQAPREEPEDPLEVFNGLSYTRDQKAKIQQVQRDFQKRMEAVSNDQKIAADVKSVMLEGYARLERGEVYKLLSPQQQSEVRRKIRARREAAKREASAHEAPAATQPVQPPRPVQPPSAK